MQPPKKTGPDEISPVCEHELEREKCGKCGKKGTPSIWPMIASMDYLIQDLAKLSPMSAYLLRMARQNLLDEYLPGKRRSDDENANTDPGT